MGEAWFMGDTRRMFADLMGDLDAVAAEQLTDPLFEIASGTHSFGPRSEWSRWFHYLLGRLLPRSHDGLVLYLLEPLITAFFAQYPSGIEPEPYRGFRSDALNTLGRCMMDSTCWSDDQIIVGKILHRSKSPNAGLWFWFDASRDFSASMFFCLKYLSAADVQNWMKSVLEIPCPHWRAQVMVWLVGAHDLLSGKKQQPAQLESADRPCIVWEGSHCLTGSFATDRGAQVEIPHFLPEANRREALAAFGSFMTDDVFLDWMCSIAEFDYLESELAELPDRFRELFMSHGASPAG